jgi:hypothetical protein
VRAYVEGPCRPVSKGRAGLCEMQGRAWQYLGALDPSISKTEKGPDR